MLTLARANSCVLIFDAVTLKIVATLRGNHDGSIHTFAWNKESQTLASGDDRGNVTLWKAPNLDAVTHYTQSKPITDLDFRSPEELMIAREDGTFIIISTNGSSPHQVPAKHPRQPYAMACDKQGNTVIIDDNALQLHSATQRRTMYPVGADFDDLGCPDFSYQEL